jgi:subtilisin
MKPGVDSDAPWRQTSRVTSPGLPAWSMSSSLHVAQRFGVSTLAEVTPEWAWAAADGSNVRVCVLDSGVDGGHPLIGALDRSVTVRAGEDGDLRVEDFPPIDKAGHGTACAGIIRGIAPKASISSVRVLTDGQNGTGAALLAGLGWAIEEGFDLINLSLATTQSRFAPALHDLADRAYFRRTVLVVSAHNRPLRSYPWTFASVVSVGSHDLDDPMTFFYNPAPPVEFHARGVQVPVAWPGGLTIRSSGNSLAAPHITGVCALILSKHTWLTPFQLKTVLFLTAANVAGRRTDPVGRHA